MSIVRRTRTWTVAWMARPYTLPIVILALGVLARVAWVHASGLQYDSLYEAGRVAEAVATRSVFGDAYRVGQGPTAHLLPINILIAGAVYALLGVRTTASEAVLAGWGIALAIAMSAFLYAAFAELGMPRRARLLALAIVCLFPVNFSFETVWFRIWEGGLAAMLGAAFLWALLRIDRVVDPSFRQIMALAMLAALAFFVSPQIGVAAYLAALVYMLDRLPRKRWPATALAATAALALLIVPWTIRNYEVFGEIVPLRSNFGLETAMVFHSGASGADESSAFGVRGTEIHPSGPIGYEKMIRAGGEVQYSRMLGAQTKKWVMSHKLRAAELAAIHFYDYIFTRTWMFMPFSPTKLYFVHIKMAMNALPFAAGLVGAIWALFLGRRYRYAAIMTLVPILPFVLVQPILRYRYIVFAMMIFFSLDLLARMLALATRPRGEVVPLVETASLPS